jgi:photosystem II stability/assembly factor-like uncharacterized protein
LGEPVQTSSHDWPDGHARAVGAACAEGHLLAVGHSASGWSDDGGETWNEASLNASWGHPTPVTSVARSEAGTWVAVGLLYVGRSTDGMQFAAYPAWFETDWFYSVAPSEGGRWWIVGEAGSIWTSMDDGQSWIDQSVSTPADLYAVDFHDASVGMAVGSHGTAWFTGDGGWTWTDVSTGLDRFLGDVHWLDADTALVVGEGGLALTWTRP